MKIFKFFPIILLCSCGGLHTGNDPLDAAVTGTSAIFKSQGASENCKQGHAQDRVNCRNSKQAKVDAITKSIKKHTDK